jgi:hypothetical protein
VPIRIQGDGTPDKQRIAAAVHDAVTRYLSLDIRRVQDACNARRDRMLRVLAPLADDDRVTMLPGLDNTTARQVRKELARPFGLTAAPQPIVIDMQDSRPDAPNAPACVRPGDPSCVGVIFVLADNIDPAGLCARDTRGPLADCAFHEMLHLCGDAVKAEDGIARHQYAGTEAIRELLGMPPLLPPP